MWIFALNLTLHMAIWKILEVEMPGCGREVDRGKFEVRSVDIPGKRRRSLETPSSSVQWGSKTVPGPQS